MEIRHQSAFTVFKALLPSANYSAVWSVRRWHPAAYSIYHLAHFFKIWSLPSSHYSLQRAPTPDPASSNYPSCDTVPLRLSPVEHNIGLANQWHSEGRGHLSCLLSSLSLSLSKWRGRTLSLLTSSSVWTGSFNLAPPPLLPLPLSSAFSRGGSWKQIRVSSTPLSSLHLLLLLVFKNRTDRLNRDGNHKEYF